MLKDDMHKCTHGIMSSELQLLCFAIDNLETQLSMAKQQRDVVLRRIQDEQFTADSIQCAEYWIQNRHAQYSKANLRDSLRNLSMCKCCDRHQLNRPSIESYDRGHTDNYTRRSAQKNGGNCANCLCSCRYYAREVCRALSELE